MCVIIYIGNHRCSNWKHIENRIGKQKTKSVRNSYCEGKQAKYCCLCSINIDKLVKILGSYKRSLDGMTYKFEQYR